jgi:hypothetical protein
MTTLAPWIEQWRHFTSDLREQFWSDLTQCTRQSWQDFLGRLSLDARDRYLGVREYERSPARDDARNGFYERDVVTRLGTVRVPVARTAEVLLLIREAFLRGLSTRVVSHVVALLTEEAVSAQTVSRLTRDLARPWPSFISRSSPMTGGGCFSKGSVCGYGDRGAASACSCSPLPEVRGTFTGLTWDGACAPFGNVHTSRAITYLWPVLARLIVQGYSCARTTTVVE